MECRKITIARLRSGVNYKRPLDHIIDSFCYLLKRFQKKLKDPRDNYKGKLNVKIIKDYLKINLPLQKAEKTISAFFNKKIFLQQSISYER